MNLHAHVAGARDRLRAAGIPDDEAAIDARLLAQHVLGWDATGYFTNGDQSPPLTFAPSFEALLERRVQREPMAYILGHQEFWGFDIAVTPDVLIPRPETELVVEAALKWLSDPGAPAAVVDVCTGSGCLAIALARERPAARLLATDISEAALRVAQANAARLGVADRVLFVRADLLDDLGGPFDMVVANPPYVPEPDRAGLQAEVRDYEPALALFAGPRGLDVISRLLAQSVGKLTPTGLLIFEFGAGQRQAIEELISQVPGLRIEAVLNDLQGIPRVVVARRHVDF